MRRVRSYSAGSNDDAYVPPMTKQGHAEGVENAGGGRYLWRRELGERCSLSEGEGMRGGGGGFGELCK